MSKLGDTLKGAQSQMSRLRIRLSEDSVLHQEYAAFIHDYELAGHMRQVSPPSVHSRSSKPLCYLPHHGIWQRADELTKKLRVVFNASFRSSSGLALNDVVYTGRALQRDLPAIIFNWMFHPIVFCTDIGQMYRQIRIDPRDADLQRIVWQSEEDNVARHYQLLTVTYGTSCAPYLAIRTLLQLAEDEGSRFPLAKQALRSDTYVDDIVTGAEDIPSACKLRDQLIQMLQAGGFPLRKWVSNKSTVIEGLPQENKLRPHWKDFSTGGPVQALGVSWDPVQDEMRFTSPETDRAGTVTKRQVLSTIARLFDPVGWLSPLVITAKILMQDLWKRKMHWDEPLSSELLSRWSRFCTDLPKISAIRIARWLGTRSTDSVQVHGFSDASQHAYAAVIYVRISSKLGSVHTRLLTSKTRVAPVKTVTIPRLELCAAVLLARLLRRVIRGLNRDIESVHARSDSRTVLAWLASEPSKWTSFVSHRVAEIQSGCQGVKWRYTPSSENPADLASRGTGLCYLKENEAWWQGPRWLARPSSQWPSTYDSASSSDVPTSEIRPTLACHQLQLEESVTPRFSSLTRLTRVIVRCLRFFKSLQEGRPSMDLPLTPSELEEGFHRCARLSQRLEFAAEISLLKQGKTLSKRNRLAGLKPFLDDDGTLRVGGRLQEAPLPFTERHPLILSRDCHLSTLILEWAHKTALHGGATVRCSYAIRRAWILGGRQRIKSVIRKCITCIRSRGKTSTQLMGALPRSRVERSRPFSKVGVDYAGPLRVKTIKGRGQRATKGYIAVFICLSTKAVHLEAVGDLTTSSFLAALRRFSSRQGSPAEIWSDNATTFRGADMELRAMLQNAEIEWDLISGALANDGMAWRFIPPAAPHFGGLWEAAVKSAKSHLKRVLGSQLLTFEELSTFLTQVEFCMNSRPLTPISGDPDDLQAVTPWHLITGFQPQLFPEPHNPSVNLDHLTHWRLVQGMRDHFWRRWATEYLNTLQQRYKWTKPTRNFQVDDLVLIVDPSLLQCGRWAMGRIIQTHPGRDHQVRVVTIKTSHGTYTRPITKLQHQPHRADLIKPPPVPSWRADNKLSRLRSEGGRNVRV